MNFSGGGYQSGGMAGGMGMAGGGGFLQQNYEITSPNLSVSPDPKKNRSAGQSQAILPVTSAMLHAVTNISGSESFVLEDREISQVTFVGEIVDVTEAQTNVLYKVDDRTGPVVEVRKWLEEQENEYDLARKAECREGIYVRVIGHLRSFKQQKSVIAFSIRPVKDFNDVTNHMMECVHSYLCHSRGPPVPAVFATQAQGSTTMGGGSWQPSGSATMATGMSTSYMGNRIDSGLSAVQQKVLNSISSCHAPQGMHVQDIIRMVTQQGCLESQIKDAVEFLCSEGHIYSTIDYDHYKSTDT